VYVHGDSKEQKGSRLTAVMLGDRVKKGPEGERVASEPTVSIL
jgi:hypothetical protein